MFRTASNRTGKLIDQVEGLEKFKAYLPHELNIDGDFLKFNTSLISLLADAQGALGKFNGITSIIPNPDLFLYMYLRKEAVLSSQIEGTQSTLDDILEYEIEEEPVITQDAKEVINYIKAMEHGIEQLQTMPICLRLLKNLHELLMQNTRGKNKLPGKFRRIQNRVSGVSYADAVYIPPPPEYVAGLLNNLEKFINISKLPSILKAGIAHAQFETIHPFLDGNGRLGRLLITLILCSEKVIDKPLLYLSLYLKTHQSEYYDQLNKVREKGDWESWLTFYLIGIKETSIQALNTAQRIMELKEVCEKEINQNFGRATNTALQLLEYLFKQPYITIPMASHKLGISQPTIRNVANLMVKHKILDKSQKKIRNQIYRFNKYTSIINVGINN